MLFSQEIVTQSAGAHVVFDVKCSKRLEQLIGSLGGRPIMTKKRSFQY